MNWLDWLIGAIFVLLVLCVVGGPVLMLLFDNGWFMLLTLFGLVVLSAG